MVTPIQIDQNLLQEALALSNHPTATALLEEALREYIQRRQQLKVLELFGTGVLVGSNGVILEVATFWMVDSLSNETRFITLLPN